MVSAANVRVAVTGAVSKAEYGATAPTGTSGSITPHVDLGYISEDGVEIELPDAGDSEPIKAWQSGTTVRVIRTPSEDNPTWTFTLLETSIETVETYFGVEVTSSASEGSFEFKNTNRPYNSYIVDVIDGTELIRDYIPRGVVTAVGSQTFSNGAPIGYEVTVEAELDSTKLFNFKRWATALKTPA